MAYKVKNTFTIKLESPEGDAVLTFKRPLATRFIRDDSNSGLTDSEKLLKEWQAIAADCTQVEGMEYEDGTPVTPEEIKSFQFDLKEIVGIVAAYNSWVFSFKKEDEAKKNSE